MQISHQARARERSPTQAVDVRTVAMAAAPSKEKVEDVSDPDSSGGASGVRQKVDVLSEKVVDTNPYSRLMCVHASFSCARCQRSHAMVV